MTKMAKPVKKKPAAPKAPKAALKKAPKKNPAHPAPIPAAAHSHAATSLSAAENAAESETLAAAQLPPEGSSDALSPAAGNATPVPASRAPVREKIKKLPAAAKAAPKKIVERTLETTLKTVEKAAETEAQKAARKALKATAKARKALKAMTKAKKAARRAEAEAAALNGAFPKTANAAPAADAATAPADTMSARVKKLPVGAKAAAAGIRQATTAAAKKAAREIKQKLKQILHSAEEEVFYYERRQIILLTVVYAAIACLVWVLTRCMLCAGLFTSWALVVFMTVVMALSLAALASVVFVLIFPQKLAVVTNEGIKIDHNAFLKWSDVALAEEKYTGWLTRRPIIALHLVPGAEYRLTFMQHLCRHNVFTPFSIPLYAMVPEDAAKIRTLVKRYAEYKDSRD